MINHHFVSEEQRIAYRGELKRKLARISVQTERVQDLKKILDSLNRDSDSAAERHEAEAGELQRELAALDEKRINDILTNQQTDKKSLSRRGEILERLAKLNTELELHCQANSKAAEPIHREINLLLKETADQTVVQNQLVSLASQETKLRLQIQQSRTMAARFAMGEAQRKHDIALENERRNAINRERKFDTSEEDLLTDQRKAIAEGLLSYWRDAIAELDREGAELRAAALTE